jgi:hypothetical protein
MKDVKGMRDLKDSSGEHGAPQRKPFMSFIPFMSFTSRLLARLL